MKTADRVRLHPPRALSRDELDRYREDGVLTGFALFDPEHAPRIRDALVRHVVSVPSAHFDRRSNDGSTDRYLDRRLIYELCSLPQILDPIRQLLGPDLVVFRSQIFDKPARGQEIPWHQESHYWGASGDWVSLWLAIDEARPDTGAMRVVPGSHREAREHPPLSGDQYWAGFERQALIRESDRILACPMAAGRFMLFADLLHSSSTNTADRPRMSFTARYARPDLTGVQDHFYHGHRCVLVSGRTGRSELNFAAPPTAGPGLESLGIGTDGHDRRPD